MMSDSHFTRLPEVVSLKILEHVSSSGDCRSLLRLAATCRQMQDLIFSATGIQNAACWKRFDVPRQAVLSYPGFLQLLARLSGANGIKSMQLPIVKESELETLPVLAGVLEMSMFAFHATDEYSQFVALLKRKFPDLESLEVASCVEAEEGENLELNLQAILDLWPNIRALDLGRYNVSVIHEGATSPALWGRLANLNVCRMDQFGREVTGMKEFYWTPVLAAGTLLKLSLIIGSRSAPWMLPILSDLATKTALKELELHCTEVVGKPVYDILPVVAKFPALQALALRFDAPVRMTPVLRFLNPAPGYFQDDDAVLDGSSDDEDDPTDNTHPESSSRVINEGKWVDFVNSASLQSLKSLVLECFEFTTPMATALVAKMLEVSTLVIRCRGRSAMDLGVFTAFRALSKLEFLSIQGGGNMRGWWKAAAAAIIDDGDFPRLKFLAIQSKHDDKYTRADKTAFAALKKVVRDTTPNVEGGALLVMAQRTGLEDEGTRERAIRLPGLKLDRWIMRRCFSGGFCSGSDEDSD